MLKLSWHFDFHSHRDVHIGRRPEPDQVAATLADAHVDEIVTFAKCHNGYSYYPTKVGNVHPQLEGDPFGAICRACHARGIKVLAYVSFGIDGEAARRHPDWAQVYSEGPQLSEDWFVPVCPFTGYTEQLMLPQIVEIIKGYPISGFWFDTMGALQGCYCDVCRQSFRDATGLEPPREKTDAGWSEFGHFRRERGLRLVAAVGNLIQKHLPGAIVAFNQIGTPGYPEPSPPGVTRLSMDYSTRSPQSFLASMYAAYGSNAAVPADIMPTIFNGGWGDWTLAPKQRHEQIAAAIWARRACAIFGDRLHPDNRLAETSKLALRQFKEIRSRIEAQYPPENAQLAPDVALLCAESLVYGSDLRHFAQDYRARLRLLDGAWMLLNSAGENVTVCGEHTLDRVMAQAKIIVLPELESIKPNTDVALNQFAERGGQVLLVGSKLPTVSGQSLAWAGVSQDPKPWQDHIYLPSFSATDPCPVLIRGDYHQTNLKGAEQIYPAIQPVDMHHGVRFGWGISPPSEQPSAFAAFTRCAIGSKGGAIWCLVAPIFSHYYEMGSWQLVHSMANMMRRIVPHPRLRLDSPYGQVEAVAQINPKTTWIVLINHGGEVLSGMRRWARTWGPLPAYSIDVLIRDIEGDRSPANVSVNGNRVDARRDADGAVRASVIMDAIWKVIRVDWA